MEGGDLRWTVRKARMMRDLLRPVSDAPRLGLTARRKLSIFSILFSVASVASLSFEFKEYLSWLIPLKRKSVSVRLKITASITPACVPCCVPMSSVSSKPFQVGDKAKAESEYRTAVPVLGTHGAQRTIHANKAAVTRAV